MDLKAGILVAALAAMVMAVLVYVSTAGRFGGRRKGTRNGAAKQRHGGRIPEKPGRPCPLCGTILTEGRKVSSILYPGKPDGMMEIHGCPFCIPPAGTAARLCPVCGKEVPADGYVIARVFSGPGKTHVHVLGCTVCYARKRPGQRA